MGDAECGGDTDWKYIVGVAASLISSAGSAIGLVMQKFAHNSQEALPEGEKWPEKGGLILSPLWMFGFVLLVIIPLPFDLVALSLAPQSIVTTLTGATIVMVQVFAPYILGERVTVTDWIATVVILVGCVLTTAFGSHCSVDYELETLLALYEEEVFLYAEVWYWFTIIVAYMMIYIGLPRMFVDGDEYSEYSRRKWTSVCYAYLAGTWAANQNIMFKSVGELIAKAWGYGDDSAWSSGYTYLLMTGVLFLSIIQLVSLNKGLAMWKATKNLPIYNVVLTVMSTTYGGIYYQEYKTMTPLGLVFFIVGLVVICFGIALLALRDDNDEDRNGSTKVHPSSYEAPDGDGVQTADVKQEGTEKADVKQDALPPIDTSVVKKEATGTPKEDRSPTRLPPIKGVTPKPTVNLITGAPATAGLSTPSNVTQP